VRGAIWVIRDLSDEEESMDPLASRVRPYALAAGERWTCRFGNIFSVQAGEAQEGRGAAFLEYVRRQGKPVASLSLPL
jgi:hypothetical protein